MPAIDISLSVNGRLVRTSAEPRTQLLELLREDLNLTGAHAGCEQGVCGACTVIVDGKPQRSCISYAGDADGASVTTIEGFDSDPLMGELRAAFTRHHGLQCGFCTPGMLITARDIVVRLGEVAPARIREELSGNLCRCTGYVGIVEAIQEVSTGKQPAATVAPAVASAAPTATPAPELVEQAVSPAKRPASAGVAAMPSRQGWTSIEQRLQIASAPADVWTKLADLKQVATCLPGAEITAIDGDHIEGRMHMALGPMKVAFKGDGTVTLDATARQGRMTGRGRDTGSGSSAEGEVEWRVLPGDGDSSASSTLAVILSWRLSGRLAQFNRAGLVQDVVQRLTSDFTANLERSLKGESAPTNQIQPISFWSLAWAILKARLAGRR
ncbi:2Fe-2S iron-sulfur cluster binding domain-containing protein [Bradyrhizobium sp. BRP22]|uniref:xanthine dehydrogenase family Fe-S subunit n=1 Tax=Bradyrhizobium sp. BRP22 TaxID=2793821 RepID=UPI001CD3F019|nr:2Fe-2S iron-sulfur cluster-binding protein [Bradyrhizobium sp. BRP22]MCA1453581.1 2Fe-2S iron-sulfur cluster binding domain-containing protein [Bradyrhizobium sp. BRP22]